MSHCLRGTELDLGTQIYWQKALGFLQGPTESLFCTIFPSRCFAYTGVCVPASCFLCEIRDQVLMFCSFSSSSEVDAQSILSFLGWVRNISCSGHLVLLTQHPLFLVTYFHFPWDADHVPYFSPPSMWLRQISTILLDPIWPEISQLVYSVPFPTEIRVRPMTLPRWIESTWDSCWNCWQRGLSFWECPRLSKCNLDATCSYFAKNMPKNKANSEKSKTVRWKKIALMTLFKSLELSVPEASTSSGSGFFRYLSQ